MSILMAGTASLLIAIGVYLVLQHKLSRIIIGLGLMTHGANVLMLGSGRFGTPPIIGRGDATDFSDPLPQALALTSIVISFGVTGLLLALAYRSWLLTHDDEVEDDVADRAMARAALRDKEIEDQEAFAIAPPDDDAEPDHALQEFPQPGEGRPVRG